MHTGLVISTMRVVLHFFFTFYIYNSSISSLRINLSHKSREISPLVFKHLTNATNFLCCAPVFFIMAQKMILQSQGASFTSHVSFWRIWIVHPEVTVFKSRSSQTCSLLFPRFFIIFPLRLVKFN